MQKKEKEKRWEELLLSLREEQSNLPLPSRKMIVVIHKLFEELKKQIEELSK